MANVGSDFKDGLNEVLKYGQIVRFRYFSMSFGAGSYYDDDVILTQSGVDLYTSGVILPIDQSRGSSDAVLIEQGKLYSNDTKLYVDGNVPVSGTYKIGLGSPPTTEYSVLSDGVVTWNVNADPIVNKVYIRILPAGSLIGE